MKIEQGITNLPKHFSDEQKQLIATGRTSWKSVQNLNDKEINVLVSNGRSTSNNLKRLRGIASLVCDLDINQEYASLLLHAGFPSIKSIAISNPEEILQKVGKLERKMSTNRSSIVNLSMTKAWIKKAKTWRK